MCCSAMGFTYWLNTSAHEVVKLSNVRPFARTLYGKISTVYEMSKGVNARLYKVCPCQQTSQ